MSEVTELSVQLQFQAGVTENLFERSRRQIFMTMHRNGNQLSFLFQYMVRSLDPISCPSILLEQLDQLFPRHTLPRLKDQ